MSLALYRKYRPKTFAEIVGQEYTVKILTNAISSGMISHAYLFTGPRGTGKTTLGRLLAKAVNCKNRKQGQYEPCNQCESCQEINKGNSIDLIEIDAASNRGIDEMRELKEGIRFMPTKSKYKVFIIDECHQLTKEANNALLKTLEEPPSHAIFVLATTEIYKMIPTIISRCQRFDFRKLRIEEIVKRLETILKKEKIEYEEPALFLIAREATGSIRDAESLLDKIISFSGENQPIKKEMVKKLLGNVEIELITQFVKYLSEKDAKKAVSFLNESIDKGVNLQQFIKALNSYLREILLLKIDSQFEDSLIFGLTAEEKEKIKEFAEKLSSEEIYQFLEKFMEAENKIKYSSIPQLPLELAIVELCSKKE
jgi:DNA polymerase-3 subunit gamma/tau